LRSPADIDKAFAAGVRDKADAYLTTNESFMIVHRARIANLAQKHRLPGIHVFTATREVGELMSYRADVIALFPRAAGYVDKILKGAKPGDLPVEQATKFEFIINRKTAAALGVTIPPSLLLRADQVIE